MLTGWGDITVENLSPGGEIIGDIVVKTSHLKGTGTSGERSQID